MLCTRIIIGCAGSANASVSCYGVVVATASERNAVVAVVASVSCYGVVATASERNAVVAVVVASVTSGGVVV